MENAETILVVILACFLAISLLLSIIFFVICIKIANRVKRLTEKAEQIADKAGAVGEFFTKTAGPLALGKLVAQVVEHIRGRDKKSSRRNK